MLLGLSQYQRRETAQIDPLAAFHRIARSGLIRSERRGNELHNETRCEELEDKFGPMIESILASYLAQSTSRRKKKR